MAVWLCAGRARLLWLAIMHLAENRRKFLCVVVKQRTPHVFTTPDFSYPDLTLSVCAAPIADYQEGWLSAILVFCAETRKQQELKGGL